MPTATDPRLAALAARIVDARRRQLTARAAWDHSPTTANQQWEEDAETRLNNLLDQWPRP